MNCKNDCSKYSMWLDCTDWKAAIPCETCTDEDGKDTK